MRTVLIVDDDELIANMLRRRLKRAGYQIEFASNGKEAIHKILQLQPEVTLMDMHMPVLNGYQATEQLRAQGYRGLIIALTASAMAQDSQKALDAGCDKFIAKPIDLSFEEKLAAIMQDFQAG